MKKVLIIAATVSLLGGGSSLQAQTTLSGDHVITGDLNVGTSDAKGNLSVTGETGGSAAPGITVTGDGGVLFGGTFGTGQIPATGSGIRFMWYPKKAALLAGKGGEQWNDLNIGNYSVNLGNSSVADGEGSVSIGYLNASDGYYSVALGLFNEATNTGSVAIGKGACSYGYASVSLGIGTATGDVSIALGGSNVAYGDFSIAVGNGTFAYGDGSFTAGLETYAAGNYATALGEYTAADSLNVLAIGRYNVGGGNSSTWATEDPIFEVGIGTGDTNDPPEEERRNALTVYKNGKIKMERQGDIPMGDFGNPE